MKIETRVIVSFADISRELARARKSTKRRKSRGGIGTSRSGRSILIKRAQGPPTLNTFEPDDVFQRGRNANGELRRSRKKNREKKRRIGSV